MNKIYRNGFYLSFAFPIFRSEEKPRSTQPRSEEPPNSFFHPETLLDALMYNSETGCFFKEFVNKQNNKVCTASQACYTRQD